jgi:hypothetical protein
MADEADDAAVLTELFLKQSLASLGTGPKLAPRGSCHFCETEFSYNNVELDRLTNQAMLGVQFTFEEWSTKGRRIAESLAAEGELSADDKALAKSLVEWAAKRREFAAKVKDEGLDALTTAALHGQNPTPEQFADKRAELAAKRLFCDADCAHDHEYEQKVKSRR